MWVVSGLGNPGRKYRRTRHNAGFIVLEELAERYGIGLAEKKGYAYGRGSIEGQDAVLVEPLSYMNRSGTAVREILAKTGAAPDQLIVIHDDIDLETGMVRVRRSGSSGGHKGIESVISSIGSRDFTRVKVGVGRDPLMLVEDYVLSGFRRSEIPLLKEAIVLAAGAVVAVIQDGVEAAMNRFNRRGGKAPISE